MLRNVVAAMGVGLLMAGLPPGVQAEEVLKLGHVGGTGSAFSAAAQSFAAEVSKATNGRYRVEEYGNSVLGDEAALLDAVKLGTVEVVITGLVGPMPAVVPETGVLILPFLFRDEAQAVKVLDGPVGQSLLDGMRAQGFQGLAWAENGFRQLTTNDIAVRTPEDVRALNIRVAKGNIIPRIWRDLGAASVVELNVNDVYAALKSGRINAEENPIPNAWGYNFFDYQNHVTLLNYIYSPLVLVMSNDVFDELGPENQKAVIRAARVAGQASRDFVAKQNQDLTARLKEKGVVFITDPDLAAFREVLKPTLAELSAKYGDIVERIRNTQ
jgi:tripartite ATP-independent transporter DctP family solute receptor